LYSTKYSKNSKINCFSQSVSIEKNHHEEPEQQQQQQTTSVEPIMVSRKQVVLSSNTAITKENTSEDTRSNRKSMFEPIITRRVSPQIAPTNTHAIERVSLIFFYNFQFFLFLFISRILYEH